MNCSLCLTEKLIKILLLLTLLLLFSSCVKHATTQTRHNEPVEKTVVKESGAVNELSSQGDLSEVSRAEETKQSDRSGEDVPKGQPSDTVSKSSQSTHESQVDAIQISLDELVERLKKTDAIGFLTKLTIRSDVLDLKASIDRYRKKGELKQAIGNLRDHFDGLLLKIMTLLERDPGLSRDIHLARESIWKSLLEAKS